MRRATLSSLLRQASLSPAGAEFEKAFGKAMDMMLRMQARYDAESDARKGRMPQRGALFGC